MCSLRGPWMSDVPGTLSNNPQLALALTMWLFSNCSVLIFFYTFMNLDIGIYFKDGFTTLIGSSRIRAACTSQVKHEMWFDLCVSFIRCDLQMILCYVTLLQKSSVQ